MVKAPYFLHIDGLRAISVMAVIAYHLNAAWLPGGFTGVDLFFVISGYVVGTSLVHTSPAGLGRFSIDFYARRFIRILPALLFCLLATSLLSVLLVPQAWLSAANEDTGLAAYFGYSNVLLSAKQDSYYSPRAEFNPFIHTWSLGVEEQFYLIIPPLILAWLSFAAARRSLVAGLIALIGASSLGMAWYLGTHNPTAAFYSIFSRFWELGIGVLLSLQTSRMHFPLQSLPRLGRLAVQVAALAAIACGLYQAQLAAFPYPWALVPVLGVAVLILSLKGEQAANPVVRLLSARLLVGIGRMSYSLYLWHWPVFVIMRWTVGLGPPILNTVAVAMTFLLAGISYRFVEQPVRTSRRIHAFPKWTVVAGAVGASVLLYNASAELFKRQPQLTLSVTGHLSDWQPHLFQEVADADHCAVTTVTTNFVNGLRFDFSSPQCAKAKDPARAVPSHIFVIGDSHAGAYLGLFKRLVNEQARGVTLYSQGGCSYLNLLEPESASGADCIKFTATSTQDILQKAKKGDVLFLPSLRVRRFGDQWNLFPEADVLNAMNGTQAQAQRRLAVAEAAAQLVPFQQAGMTIVLEAPKPIFKAPLYRCSDWFNQHNPICDPGFKVDREFLLEYRDPSVAALLEVQHAAPQTVLWDPFPVLCPAGAFCDAVSDGQPLFFDGDHLSGVGNMRLFEAFNRCVEAAGNCPTVPRPRKAGLPL